MKTGVGILVLAAILLCGILPTVSSGQLITIGLTGKITYADDPRNIFGGQIHLNDTVTGTYIYDLLTPDSTPDDPVQGNYWHYSPPCGVSIDIKGFRFQSDNLSPKFHLAIRNNISLSDNDIYAFVSYANLPLPNGALVESISWQLEDSTGTALSSDALPATAPNLVDWDMDYGLHIEGPRGWDYFIIADVTSVYVIPEPATLLLLVFGAAICKRH